MIGPMCIHFILGTRLLRAMGWTEGQTVGVRRKRRIAKGTHWIPNESADSGVFLLTFDCY